MIKTPDERACLAEVLERVLDKGIVIEIWADVALVGIDLLSVRAGVVVASIPTYQRFSDPDAYRLPAVESGPTREGFHGPTLTSRSNGAHARGATPSAPPDGTATVDGTAPGDGSVPRSPQSSGAPASDHVRLLVDAMRGIPRRDQPPAPSDSELGPREDEYVRASRIVRRHGGPADLDALRALDAATEEAWGAGDGRLDRISRDVTDLAWRVLARQDGFWLALLQTMADQKHVTGRSRARVILDEATCALQTHDMPTLRHAIWRLWKLLPAERRVALVEGLRHDGIAP